MVDTNRGSALLDVTQTLDRAIDVLQQAGPGGGVNYATDILAFVGAGAGDEIHFMVPTGGLIPKAITSCSVFNVTGGSTAVTNAAVIDVADVGVAGILGAPGSTGLIAAYIDASNRLAVVGYTTFAPATNYSVRFGFLY